MIGSFYRQKGLSMPGFGKLPIAKDVNNVCYQQIFSSPSRVLFNGYAVVEFIAGRFSFLMEKTLFSCSVYFLFLLLFFSLDKCYLVFS